MSVWNRDQLWGTGLFCSHSFHPNWAQIWTEFPSITVMWLLGVERTETVGGANSPVGAIKPLQKKRTQQDEVNKKEPVKPQTVENDEESMMEILHLCLFHVTFEEGYSRITGRLITCFMYIMSYSLIYFPLTLSHFVFSAKTDLFSNFWRFHSRFLMQNLSCA